MLLGIIYYKDIVDFAKKDNFPVLQILDEFECDCGKLKSLSKKNL